MTTGARQDLQETTPIEEALLSGSSPSTLGAFIEERARSLGDQIAAIWFQDSRQLSYQEIHEQADRLACSLSRLGMRKGAHVGVMLPNIAETLVTWTAIGRIGAVMVPINFGYTPTELAFVLNDSDAQFLIVDQSCLDKFDSMAERPRMIIDSRVIVVGAAPAGRLTWGVLVEEGHFPFSPPDKVEGSDLLNIQYTSGTTGFPKGCMLTHDYWMRTGFSLAFTRGDESAGRNVLVWAPFYYMDGMWQILSTFCLGGTAHIARRMSIKHFLDWLRDFKIDSCTFPEAALKALPAGPADEGIRLKYIYAFGWRAESKREAERRFGCRARDAYGMTELGTATVTPIHCGERNFQRTCGIPAPQRKLKIVDETGNEVQRGALGELWVSGPGIMWGYYKRPDANAECFRGPWFRTGDIFRQDEDGYYFIVGRMKDMVKRSGENIAAREVEGVLNTIEEVLESAIVPVPDPRRGEEVKAYIRLREGLSPDQCQPARILAHCTQHLASFKLPRYIEYVEDFPRTATGKIAKRTMVDASSDLRQNSYDWVDQLWR